MLGSLLGKVWWNMAVPVGFGGSQLDFTICYRGWFIAIETKRSAKHEPTLRQAVIISEIEEAGGLCFLCYDAASVEIARRVISQLPLRGTPFEPIGPSLREKFPHVALRP